MKKSWISLVFSLFLFGRFFLLDSYAGKITIDSNMQFRYAQSLFEQKDLDTSIIEFKRFVHFFPSDRRVFEAKYKIGTGLYLSGKYHEAAKIFNSLILEKADHEFKCQSVLLQSQAFRQMGNLGYARLILYNYLQLTPHVQVQDKIYSMLADLDVLASKGVDAAALEQAKAQLEKISDVGKQKYQSIDRVDTLDKALEVPQKDPATAGVMAVIPGGGFLYCERYQDALVSFLLNVGLMYASYEAFDEGHEALGGVLAFVETGFYSGNIYGSITAAHRHNRRKKIQILNQSFDVFSNVDIEKQSLQLGLKLDF